MTEGLSRRGFLGYCIASAAVLGLGPLDLFKIKTALANPSAPKVIWLQGSGCSGCSISFLNLVSEVAPVNVPAFLTDTVDLLFHPTLMWASGEQASQIVAKALREQDYILVVEGGVPTAFEGGACLPWSEGGVEVTFQQAITRAVARAKKVICVGTCATYGGVSAAGENPAIVKSVSDYCGVQTLNISGCPPHPNAIVWAIAQVLANNPINVDVFGRPTEIYGKSVHSECPRNRTKTGKDWANAAGVDHLCLELLGCRGPDTYAPCPTWQWNDKANWCVDANGTCVGCTEPSFPGTHKFHRTIS
jgi:NiFe hydrogenase small subunit HydA